MTDTPLNWSRVAGAGVSATALLLISPPINWAWLFWVILLPLLWSLRDEHPFHNAILGYIFGAVGTHTSLFWIKDTVLLFSNVPGPGALVVTQLYATVFPLPIALVFASVMPFRRRFGLGWILLMPALQVAYEYAWPQLFAFQLGSVQYRTLPIFQLASVTGVYGLTFLGFVTNCALAECIYRRREGRPPPWRTLAAAAATPLLIAAWGSQRIKAMDAELEQARVLRVGLIQENTTMQQRMRTPAKTEFRSWIKRTLDLLPQDPDLVVWSEGACPYNPHEGDVAKLLSKLTRANDFGLLVGGGTREREVDPRDGKPLVISYNSTYYYDRNGVLKGRYDKMVPLPFGEFIPFGETFPILYDWLQGPGRFRAGTVPTVFEADDYTLSTSICYEGILEPVIRDLSAADLLINVTNDAWFGDWLCPFQHAMLTAMRATEFGRPLVREAFTGINMVVEPTGRIVFETLPYEDRSDVVPVRMGRFETFYGRAGNWFAWLCLLASFGGVIGIWRARGVKEAE
jgi:apolipoprotein N-acyltransferase